MKVDASTTMEVATIGQSKLSEVALQYREEVAGGGGNYWALAIPVAALAIAGALYWLYQRGPAIVNTPDGMLHELCKAHGIGAGPRKLLEKIARAAELPQPAILFVSIDHFEQAVQAAAKRVRFERRAQSHLGMLRRRLFAAEGS
ncbi:MAG: hypothetical protein AAF958_08045 [Planctomycetota bacterium]